MLITRFEKALKGENRTRVDAIDLIVIKQMNGGAHPDCSPAEIEEVEKMIKEKDIYASAISLFYWNGKGYKGWNASVGKVTMCLSKAQWDLLTKYYREYVKSDV